MLREKEETFHFTLLDFSVNVGMGRKASNYYGYIAGNLAEKRKKGIY